MSFDLYPDETKKHLDSLQKVSVLKDDFFDRFFSIDTLAFIVGSGFAFTLIFFPIAYLALAGQFKFKLPLKMTLGLFCLSVPLVGVTQALLGRGDTNTLSGWFVLFGVPLTVSLAVVFAAYRSSSKRKPSLVESSLMQSSIARHLHRFSKPAERVAFIVLILGLCLLLIGLIGFWFDRGFYWSQIKYDLTEIFIEKTSYTRGWSQLCARIGLALIAVGYAVAYHHKRIVVPFYSHVGKFVRWIRTGK